MPPKPYLDLDKIKQSFPHLGNLELFDVGGQKIVYKATHPTFGFIMMKFFKTNEENPRIAREIAIAKKLIHDNLPRLYEADSVCFDGFESKVIYLMEEYINGETLRLRLQKGPIEMATCKHFLETMFSVLQLLYQNSQQF